MVGVGDRVTVRACGWVRNRVLVSLRARARVRVRVTLGIGSVFG